MNTESSTDQIGQTIERIAQGLSLKAWREFGKLERLALRRSMEACGMTEYPSNPTGDSVYGERCSGDMICDRCGKEYAVHPMDWRIIGYGDVPFLNVLCDGRRVKL